MGGCVSLLPGQHHKRCSTQRAARRQQLLGPCELERLPHQVLAAILARLPQRELLQTVPLVCTSWQRAASEATRGLTLNLSSPERQTQLPYLFTWLQENGRQLQQLQLSSSTPLGRASRKALLRSLCSERCSSSQQQPQPYSTSDATPTSFYINTITNNSSWDLTGSSTINSRSLQQLLQAAQSASAAPAHSALPDRRLQLQQLALQMDLDTSDLVFLAQHVLTQAPALHTLKLQPLKPSLADLQLLVLACIVGNLVGAAAPGPVLPHLSGCGWAVKMLTLTTATQLRSLSLSRYDIGSSIGAVTAASRLTSLALLQCSLTDSSVAGLKELSCLQRLELADNDLTSACIPEIAKLTRLTHLDLSVLPCRQRMRNAASADISTLAQLQALIELNLIGFGAADVSQALGQMRHLARLEVGLNPLNIGSLRTIGRIGTLKHLELGGISQAWMLSSGLPPDVTARGQALYWFGLKGLQTVTALDLGGSHFTHAVWVGHMCPLLGSLSSLQRLMLAHCSVPTGKLQYLLPLLSTSLVDLNIDRLPVAGDELLGLAHCTRLTRLSAAAMTPELDNKQAALLAKLTSLQHLVVRSNAIGARGALALGKGLTALTCLDLTNCPIGRRASRQLDTILVKADSSALEELDNRCW